MRQALGRLQSPPIDVNRIAERLKSVKTDPDRQDDLQRPRVDLPANLVRKLDEVLTEEIEVLKECQQAEVVHQTDAQPHTPVARCLGAPKRIAHRKVDQARKQHQPAEAIVPPSVKQVTRENQDRILRGSAPLHPVQRENGRQKKEKGQAGKRHMSTWGLADAVMAFAVRCW